MPAESDDVSEITVASSVISLVSSKTSKALKESCPASYLFYKLCDFYLFWNEGCIDPICCFKSESQGH
jgi:hypothetical protein